MFSKNFNNIGFIETKLSEKNLTRLKTYIKDTKKLPGSITDTDNWFFNNVLIPQIAHFKKSFGSEAFPITSTKKCGLQLNTFWVNVQKKYEFQLPVHHHYGVFSFVIWIKIPASSQEEMELPFVKKSRSQLPNTFQFLYTNSVGEISTHNYSLNPSYEGTMLFFSSKLNHCVYPFYSSNKKRISISGNISLNPEASIDA